MIKRDYTDYDYCSHFRTSIFTKKREEKVTKYQSNNEGYEVKLDTWFLYS